MSIDTAFTLIGVWLVFFGLWRLRQFSLAALDRFEAHNKQEHAKANYDNSRAVRVLNIPGVTHQVILLKGIDHEIIDIDPPPVVTQSGDVLTADDAKILAAASRLVDLSIASNKPDEQGRTGNASNRIASADEADTKIGMKWQQVADYMATRGWIRKDNKAGTWCINDTPNLAALRVAVAFAALPARQK